MTVIGNNPNFKSKFIVVSAPMRSSTLRPGVPGTFVESLVLHSFQQPVANDFG